MDKIQFEYRYEVQELMKVIDKYVKQNPSEKENINYGSIFSSE